MKPSLFRIFLVFLTFSSMISVSENAQGVSEPDYYKLGTLPTDQLMHPPELRKVKDSKSYFSTVRSCMKRNGFNYRRPTSDEFKLIIPTSPIGSAMSQKAQEAWVKKFGSGLLQVLENTETPEQAKNILVKIKDGIEAYLPEFADGSIDEDQRTAYFTALRDCAFAQRYPPITVIRSVSPKVEKIARLIDSKMAFNATLQGKLCPVVDFSDPSSQMSTFARWNELANQRKSLLSDFAQGKADLDREALLSIEKDLGETHLQCMRLFREFEISSNRTAGLLDADPENGQNSREDIRFSFSIPNADSQLLEPKIPSSNSGIPFQQNELGLSIFREQFVGLSCENYAAKLSRLIADSATSSTQKELNDYFTSRLINLNIDYGWKIEFHKPATFNSQEKGFDSSKFQHVNFNAAGFLHDLNFYVRTKLFEYPIDGPCNSRQFYDNMRDQLTDEVITRLSTPPLDERKNSLELSLVLTKRAISSLSFIDNEFSADELQTPSQK